MSDSETNSFTFSNAADIEEGVSAKKISYAKLKKGRYTCNECSTKFCTQFLLNLHRVSRCPKLPYPCHICEMRFSNEYNYKSHQKIHSAPKKQTAIAETDAKLAVSDTNSGRPVARKGSKRTTSSIGLNSSFTRNRRTSARFLKEEALDFIERQKTQAKSLRDTTSVAKKDLKLDDDELDTKKGKKITLKNKTPSSSEARDDEVFSCELCKIDFPDNTKLERHMIVHGKKRSYQCNKCHMGFHWKSNFNRHMKTHCAPLSKTYVCVTCGRVFSRRFCLFRHRQTRHPEEEAYLEDEQLTDILSLPVIEDDKPQKVDDAIHETVKEVDEYVKDSFREEVIQDSVKEVDDEDTDVYSDDGGDMKSNEDDTTYYASEQEDEKVSTWRRRRNEKEPRRHPCNVCHIQFKWKCDLNRHRTTHNDVKAYPCDLCELGFNWKSNLTRHKKAVHLIGVEKATHTCDMCGQKFIKKFHLDRHVTRYCVQRPALLEDMQAEAVVKTEEEVKEESVEKIPEEAEVKEKSNGEASEEDQIEETQEEILSDINQNGQEEILPDVNQNVNIVYLHVCQNKGNVYDTESACENVTSSSSIHDDDEKRSFNTATENGVVLNLEDVAETNLTDKIQFKKEIEDSDSIDLNPFVCSTCGRRFARKTCHVQHERSHVIKPTKCQWCGKDFRRLSMLQKHERMQHKGEKPFPCDICSSHFELKSQLMQHMKSHFKQKSQLVEHLKSQQSKEKALECEFCKCRFGRQSLLDRHQLVHVGERPYKCGTCDLTFDQSCSLVLHQRMHVIEYKCSKCDLKFTQQVVYVRHLERVHFKDSVQNDTSNRRVPTRKNWTSNRTADPHAYNTRYKACKAEVFIEVENTVGQSVDMDDGTSASEFKPKFYNSALNHELFKPDEYESTIASSIENTDTVGYLIGGEYGTNQQCDPQKLAESRSQEVFTKRQLRKDISVYESDSLNEFIKSYKRKHCDRGENSSSSVNTKFEVQNEDTNLETVPNKKIKNKNSKNRSRRSSEEISISEGLANVHIGTFENNEFGNNMPKDSNESNSSTVESQSFDKNLTADSNDESYTKQGTYIFQDIITVESVLPSNLKCNEDKESSNAAECDSASVEEKLLSNESREINETALEGTGYDESSTLTRELFKHNETYGNAACVTENVYCGKDNLEDHRCKLDIKDKTSEVAQENADIKQFNIVEVDQQSNQITKNQLSNISNMKPVQSDSLEHQGGPELDNSTKTANGKLIQETDQFVQCASVELNKASALKNCNYTDKANQNKISDFKSLLDSKESKDNNDKELNASESVDRSKAEILPTQVKVIKYGCSVQQEMSSNNEETSRFRPYIEIVKVSKNNSEDEKDIESNGNLNQDSHFIRKLQSLTDKLKENPNLNDESSGAVDELVQKHKMQSNHFDELAHETDEMSIDKDNDGICEIHADKNDCIRGICTDNDYCLNDINADNDCINDIDNDKDCITEIPTNHNDCLNEIRPYHSNNFFASVRAEASYSCHESKNSSRLVETSKNGLSLNGNSFKKTQSTFQEATNVRDPHVASKQCIPERHANNTLTNTNHIFDKAALSRELNNVHHNPTFDKIGENSQYSQSSMKQEKALNLTCCNHHIIQPPVWKDVFDGASNNNLPSCQYEFHANGKHTNGGSYNFYTGPRVDQNQQVKTLALNADMHNKQFSQYRNENQFPQESAWKETQLKEYPLHHNFVSHNENFPVYNMPTGEAYYTKNPWNQQDGMLTERNNHGSNEITSNYQEPPYENDIDEESIRYAVQTVQAIIQAEKPIHREAPCRQKPIQELVRYETPSFQVPVPNDYGAQETFQAPVHEVIRYHNFQIPYQYDNRVQEASDRGSVFVHTPVQDMARYQTPTFQAPVQNDGYVAQGPYREGYLNSYPGFQPQYKDSLGSAQYGANNFENPLRYSYVDRNVDVQKIPIPVRPESVIDHEGRLVQLPVQYRDSHFGTYPARRNSVLYREHFEEGPKQYLDLVPVPYSSNSESYPNDRASVNCIQLAPYERVEVTETVYTNLEYAKPNASEVFIPYKEVFNDSGVVHKGQRSIVQNIHYKDVQPYSATPDSYYTHPVRAQTLHAPSPALFHYEKAYTYPSGNEINFQGPMHQVGQFAQQRNPYSSLQQDVPKNSQNSILISQTTRGRKRVRRGRVQSEVTTPKKPRRKKNECSNAVEQQKNIDRGHSGGDRVERSTMINQFGPNLNKIIETDNNEEIRIDSRGNLSKDLSQYSMHDIEIRFSEKSFGCDECSRVFLLKNELLRHRFTEHQRNQLGSH